MYFPIGFDAAGLMLDWGAGAPHLISGFFTKGIDPYAVESVCPCGKRSPGLPIVANLLWA